MRPRAAPSNFEGVLVLGPGKRPGVTPPFADWSPTPSPFSLTLLQAHVLLSLFHVQSYQRFRDSFPGRVHQDWDGQKNKGSVRRGKWVVSGKLWVGLGRHWTGEGMDLVRRGGSSQGKGHGRGLRGRPLKGRYREKGWGPRDFRRGVWWESAGENACRLE